MKTKITFKALALISSFILAAEGMSEDAVHFDYLIVSTLQDLYKTPSNIKRHTDQKVYVSPRLSLKNSVFERPLKNFSFEGSPVGLISRLRKIDQRIDFSRTFGGNNSEEIDTTTRLIIKDFSGPILELLTNAFPKKYHHPIWVAHMDENGAVVIRFGGPIKETPRLSNPDSVDFIPPPSK